MLSVHAMTFSQVGYLTIDSPANMTIYLDSLLIARQPFADLAVLSGRYMISIAPVNDFSWNQRSQGKEIEIKPFERKYVDLNGLSQVKIYSNPIGSDVFAGNKFLGKTPLILPRTDIEGQELQLKRAGYKEQKLSLSPDQSEFTLNLTPIDPEQVQRVNEVLLGGTKVNWLRESLVLTSFVSSWAAFFFKRKADDLYTQYQGASIPGRIDYLYNETQKYDRYSEVALGVSAVSLGVYIFILVTE